VLRDQYPKPRRFYTAMAEAGVDEQQARAINSLG
jgi:hypothetical protein